MFLIFYSYLSYSLTWLIFVLSNNDLYCGILFSIKVVFPHWIEDDFYLYGLKCAYVSYISFAFFNSFSFNILSFSHSFIFLFKYYSLFSKFKIIFDIVSIFFLSIWSIFSKFSLWIFIFIFILSILFWIIKWLIFLSLLIISCFSDKTSILLFFYLASFDNFLILFSMSCIPFAANNFYRVLQIVFFLSISMLFSCYSVSFLISLYSFIRSILLFTIWLTSYILFSIDFLSVGYFYFIF